jgi:hypothetical protein
MLLEGMPASAREHPEDRTSTRIRAPGWAVIDFAGSVVKSDRLYDVSMEGISMFLELPLQLRREYHMRLSVYRHGKEHLLEVQAQCVYATLVGVDGFRHGFSFLSMGGHQQEVLAQILA